MVEHPQEDGSAFNELLGEFGKHGDREKRAKAERLAMMKPGDGRRNRGVKRPHQFNVRVSDTTKALADEIIKKFAARDGRAWSQADLVEHAIAILANMATIMLDDARQARNGSRKPRPESPDRLRDIPVRRSRTAPHW